jgi:hypothetical protein
MEYKGGPCPETNKFDMYLEQERKKQEKKTGVQECPKCNKPMSFHGQIAFCGCGLIEPKGYHLSGRNRDTSPEKPKKADKLGEIIHYAAMGLSMERKEEMEKKEKKNRDKSPERGKKSDGCPVCGTKKGDHFMCINLKEEYENIVLTHNRLDNALQACQKIIDAIDSPGTLKKSELYYQLSVLDDEIDAARKLSDNICE